MTKKSKGRSRLAIRYFDDRVLLTDTHAWAYYRVPSVSLRVHHAGGARGAGDEHHRGARGDPDAGRRGAPADRAPAVPGGGVGDRPGRHVGRRPGLAGVPGPDLPARVGEGLLVQGDLPRGQARPAQHAGAADRRLVHAVLHHLPDRRADPRHRRRGRARRGDRQVDRAGRAARPRAQLERARRAARHLPRGGVAGPAHADGVAQRPAAVRDAAQEVGARRGRAAVRGPGAQRPDAAAA